jgi:uncharacterized protein (DUF2141 family)
MRRLGFALILLLAFGMAGNVLAQGSGQLCVRAFDDRDGNGKLDPGEPLLTRGVSVNLLNPQGVTIASAVLDNSPTAAQGVVCFQGLTAGQYSVQVSSADYTATTSDLVTTTIADGGVPTVVEFGGRSAAASAPAASEAPVESQRDLIVRIIVSSLGTLLVVSGMLVLGFIVYWAMFRNRRPVPAGALDPRRTTGTMSAVRTRDTAEFQRPDV